MMNNLPDFGDAHDQHGEDAADFLELALGLLSNYSGLRARELLVGTIPEQWPSDVPILDGSRITGSLVRGGSQSENSDDFTDMTLLLTIYLPPDDVLETYDKLLLAAGWRTYDMDEKGGGFSNFSTKWDLEYIKSAYGPRLQVRARKVDGKGVALGNEGAEAPTEVRLYLDKDPSSLWHYRNREEPTLRSERLMPALRPPRRSQQWSLAGNGSETTWTSNMGMLTELDSASLMAHYASQLGSVGWVPADEGQSGPLRWQTWDVRDDQGESWMGALLILRRQIAYASIRRRYYLSVHIFKVI